MVTLKEYFTGGESFLFVTFGDIFIVKLAYNHGCATARTPAVIKEIMKNLLVLLSAVFVLSGCQSLPPLNFSVPNVGYSQKKIDAELKSMTVAIARADEKTGDLPAGMESLVPQLWQNSMQESINRMSVFTDDSPTKINIAVKILKLDIPGAGFEFETSTSARYEIINRKNGDIIFTQDISSTGVVPVGYAFMGLVRQRESINRAVQNNITQFLQVLETIDLAKPMFPTARAK